MDYKITKRVILYFTLGLIVVAVFTVLLWPTRVVRDFKNRNYCSTIFAATGEVLKVIPLQDGLRRIPCSEKELSKSAKKILLTSEDKNFFRHTGVDFFALFRAIADGVKNNSFSSGAATISMQCARMVVPVRRTVSGKVLEALNAIKLEFYYSKKDILNFWLSNLPYGQNCEGIASAAKKFFNLEVSKLTNEQVALLAVIPRSPNFYAPSNNPNLLKRQMQNLLKRAKVSFSEENIDSAISEAVEISSHSNYKTLAPHFCLFVEKEISKLNKEILSNGSKIVTTLNYNFQTECEELLSQAIFEARESRISNGAVLVQNCLTGELLAYVGSNSFYDSAALGQNDGVRALNQPGSTLKPFLYELALEEGSSLATTLADVPTSFGQGDLYRPQNFDNRFSGPVRIREALAASLNVPAVAQLDLLGVDKFLDRLLELKIASLNGERDKVGLGLALGNGRVTLLELTNAYAILARGGKSLSPIMLKEIKFASNQKKSNQKKILNSIFPLTTQLAEIQILKTTACSLIIDTLRDESHRVKGFGARQVYTKNNPMILKTGTSNQFNNIWAFASSPVFTVGVWLGNFDGSTVLRQTGSSLPTSVAVSFLSHRERCEKDFIKVSGCKKENICILSGMAATSLCPQTMEEYIQNEIKLESCTFHTEDGLELPPIYQSFAATRLLDSYNLSSNQIVVSEPIESAFYYINSGENIERQKIPIKIFASRETFFTLKIDGKVAIKASGNLDYLYLPTHGKHRLEVVQEGSGVVISRDFFVNF